MSPIALTLAPHLQTCCGDMLTEYKARGRDATFPVAAGNAGKSCCAAPDCSGSPAPNGFRLAQANEICLGKALIGASVLYWWPAEGWVRGKVRKISRRAEFSHVVAYSRSSPLGKAVVDTLLDAASHGTVGRWVLLLPVRH